jgi:hypothetical protein
MKDKELQAKRAVLEGRMRSAGLLENGCRRNLEMGRARGSLAI